MKPYPETRYPAICSFYPDVRSLGSPSSYSLPWSAQQFTPSFDSIQFLASQQKAEDVWISRGLGHGGLWIF
jgi:hypothetical protein